MRPRTVKEVAKDVYSELHKRRRRAQIVARHLLPEDGCRRCGSGNQPLCNSCAGPQLQLPLFSTPAA